MHAVLVPAGAEGAPAHAPEAYLSAAETLLTHLLRDGCAERGSALDLLVADALVTYAFEAAGDDPARLARRAATATSRIAALAGDPPVPRGPDAGDGR
jgi:hypothetical protein